MQEPVALRQLLQPFQDGCFFLHREHRGGDNAASQALLLLAEGFCPLELMQVMMDRSKLPGISAQPPRLLANQPQHGAAMNLLKYNPLAFLKRNQFNRLRRLDALLVDIFTDLIFVFHIVRRNIPAIELQNLPCPIFPDLRCSSFPNLLPRHAVPPKVTPD
ncbi:hypothetical protein D3C73_788420 [compost metagenome]